ncbi:MAG: BRO family protein [Planctomycetia bacterium]|nr:BRO family protein [Planctomycetia bacterium]
MDCTSNITTFSFQSQEVRTLILDFEIWFCGKDICQQLEYANSRKAINDHCKGVTKRYPLQTSGGLQEMIFISEPDVWRLICSSHLPKAVELERWIFEEILPTLRRTGRYDVGWRERCRREEFVELLEGVVPFLEEGKKVLVRQTTRGFTVELTQKSRWSVGRRKGLTETEAWLRETFVFVPNVEVGISTADVQLQYKVWCQLHGRQPTTNSMLGQIAELICRLPRLTYHELSLLTGGSESTLKQNVKVRKILNSQRGSSYCDAKERYGG